MKIIFKKRIFKELRKKLKKKVKRHQIFSFLWKRHAQNKARSS